MRVMERDRVRENRQKKTDMGEKTRERERE